MGTAKPFSSSLGQFPFTRMRRNRQAKWIRSLVQETQVSVKDLIWPVFVIEGKNSKEPVVSMPGVHRYSIDLLIEKAQAAFELGIPCLALFPKIDSKLRNEKASEALHPDNLICRAIRAVKEKVPELGIMCDVALDPYTSHGHDGILIKGKVDNDSTLEIIVEQALVCAKAGCDILGPSEMMDGRVGAIRKALEDNKLKDTLIMSYSAKYASSFYGPFRDAVGSTSTFKGDKKTYQQDPANTDEALREVALDLSEGADMVMIKPGLPYLDVVYRVKQQFQVPTFVYHVSGEYSMLKAASQNGWLDGGKTLMESLMAFKRAGADGILTYAAFEVAQNWRAYS